MKINQICEIGVLLERIEYLEKELKELNMNFKNRKETLYQNQKDKEEEIQRKYRRNE